MSQFSDLRGGGRFRAKARALTNHPAREGASAISLLYNLQVLSAPIDDSTTHYSDPSLNAMLAQADYVTIYARTSNPGGTSPTLTVELEHSLDNRHWATKDAIIEGKAIDTNPVTDTIASSTSTSGGGGFYRFAVSMGGSSSPNALLDLWVTGRSS